MRYCIALHHAADWYVTQWDDDGCTIPSIEADLMSAELFTSELIEVVQYVSWYVLIL